MQSKDIIVVKSDIEKLREALFNHVKLESDFVRAKTKEFVTFLEKEAKVATERAQLEDKAAPNKTFKMSVDNDDALSLGFRRWAESNIVPTSSKEALTLGVHCLMIENNFTNLVEIPSTVPGFAPSIRNVSPEKFVPDQWATSSISQGLLYKHPKIKAPVSILYKDSEKGEIHIAVSHKDKAILEIKLELSSLVHTSALTGEPSVVTPMALFSDVERLRKQTIAPILESISHAMGEDLFAAPFSARPPSVPGPAPALFAPPPRSMRVGESDLNPAGVPDFDRRPQIIDPLGGGNLVGPGHPLFGGGSSGLDRRDPGYPAFPRAPQPRFDPYGPVPGANGPDFGQGPGRVPCGEPEPDHLKPPGVPDPLQVDPNNPNKPQQFNFPGAGRGRDTRGLGGNGGGLGPF